MKNIFFIIVIFVFLFFNFVKPTFAADTPTETFLKAEVTNVINEGKTITDTGTYPFQEIVLKILEGSEKNKLIKIEYGKDFDITDDQLLKVGDKVVLAQVLDQDIATYQIVSKYRLDAILPVIIFFLILVIALSGWKGFGSIVGMFMSLVVILKYIVPQILNGQNPLTVSIIGCMFILVTTIYLAHGFSAKTTIAVISTFITLIGIGFLATTLVDTTFLTGLASEDAAMLKFGLTTNIDFRGLLLGGILIGSLGVLDDITTGLTASIFEIAKANNKMSFNKVFSSGLSVGKEHISSLVNTLVLAYAGSSLPIFLMLIINADRYPFWFMLNDGIIVEEIVRTIAGSIGLIAAVPLTTFMASYYVTLFRPSEEKQRS